jgi:hypothetical protein
VYRKSGSKRKKVAAAAAAGANLFVLLSFPFCGMKFCWQSALCVCSCIKNDLEARPPLFVNRKAETQEKEFIMQKGDAVCAAAARPL